jgi:MoaD family protein
LAKVKVKVASIIAGSKEPKEISISASTVKEALEKVAEKYGESFKKRFYDSAGNPTALLNLYVNGKSIRKDQLETRLKEGDVIGILVAIGGG